MVQSIISRPEDLLSCITDDAVLFVADIGPMVRCQQSLAKLKRMAVNLIIEQGFLIKRKCFSSSQRCSFIISC